MPSARSFFRVRFTWLFRAWALRRCAHVIFLTAFASSFSFDRRDDNPHERTSAASAVCRWQIVSSGLFSPPFLTHTCPRHSANKDPRPEAVVLGRPPRGGRFRAVAPSGGEDMGKAPTGPQRLLEVEFTLTTLQLLLLADVPPHPGLVQAHRADAIPRRPEMQPRQPTLGEQLPVDPHDTLALQEADRMGHAGLGRDAQAQVDVVGHRMPFHQVDPSLTAQLPQDHADLPPQPPVEDLPAIFRYDHDVVIAVPPHMGKVTPLVHRLALQPVGGLPGGRAYAV